MKVKTQKSYNMDMIKIDEKLIKDIFPKRDDQAHKGTYHKVLMIGGSKHMHGALEIASKAAYHSGVGTLTLLIPSSIYLIEALKSDLMLIDVKSDEDGFMVYDPKIKEIANNYDIIAIGNGMGRNEVTYMILKDILSLEKKVIVDADALFHLSKVKDIRAQMIMTPHIKEFGYLISKNVKDLDEAQKYLDEYDLKDHVLILKSSKTIVATKDERYILDAPTSVLAKGGSGDILCGIISGILAQGISLKKAALIATYVHNRLGHLYDKDPLYVIPDELIALLDKAYQELR